MRRYPALPSRDRRPFRATRFRRGRGRRGARRGLLALPRGAIRPDTRSHDARSRCGATSSRSRAVWCVAEDARESQFPEARRGRDGRTPVGRDCRPRVFDRRRTRGGIDRSLRGTPTHATMEPAKPIKFTVLGDAIVDVSVGASRPRGLPVASPTRKGATTTTTTIVVRATTIPTRSTLHALGVAVVPPPPPRPRTSR